MRLISVIIGFLLPAMLTAAQVYGPRQPDRELGAQTRNAVLDALADALEERYETPAMARKLADRVRRLKEFGTFDRVASAGDLASKLTLDLRKTSEDPRLRVLYSYQPIPETTAREGLPGEPAGNQWSAARWSNHGFQSAGILEGNIGYVDLRAFAAGADAATVASSAFRFLANTDALIVDLRENVGGPHLAWQGLVRCFVEPEVHETASTGAGSGVDTSVRGKKLFLLVGPSTSLAARKFADTLQSRGGATIIRGRGDWDTEQPENVRLNEHFYLLVPRRSLASGTEVKLQADVEVVGANALQEAHRIAGQWLLEHTADSEQRAALHALFGAPPRKETSRTKVRRQQVLTRPLTP